MRCTVCGEETFNEENTCSNCQAKLNQVQVLSPEERENFNGLTIEEGSSKREYSGPENRHSYQRVYTFNSANSGILTKLIVGIILLILTIIVFPIAMILLALFGLSWLLRRSNS